MVSDWPLLSLLIWLPIFGAAGLVAVGERTPSMVRPLALLVALVAFG